MKHIKTFESFLNEADGFGKVTFSIDDEKLDQLLHNNYGKKLDYVKVRGDEYYTLPRVEFDRFIDAAYSRGFDTDYEDSPDSVIYVHESVVNESEEYFIEVSVKDANKALDHLRDVHRNKYKTDGSNFYIFKDEEEASDALGHFNELGIEVVDTNIK
jgi:hypothetical protein